MTGYQSKKAAAQAIDKVNLADHEPDGLAQPEQEPVAWKNAAIRLGEELASVGPEGYYDMTAEQWLDWAMAQEPRNKNKLAQPEQEPQICCGEYDKCLRACTPRGRHLAQPAQRTEQNFCPRCGKRTKDIHTCTPPSQEFNT